MTLNPIAFIGFDIEGAAVSWGTTIQLAESLGSCAKVLPATQRAVDSFKLEFLVEVVDGIACSAYEAIQA